jgi:hypothetical protein
MSSKRKEKKGEDCAEKAARFFIACKANAATRLLISAAMRAKGFGCQGHGLNCSPAGAPQVSKNNVKDTPRAETVAASAMLALSNTTHAVRCHVQNQWQRVPWRLTLSAKVMIGKQRG